MGERLRDKVAIVTGASRGIGAAIAANMAEEGAKVVLVSRKIDGLQGVAEGIRGNGGDAMPIACHVGHPEQREAMLDQALQAYGKVDILVNNAATNPHFGPMLSIDGGAWDKTFEVNVKGYFGMIQLVAGHLQQRNAKGSIVNIASVVGLMAAPMQGVYAMTKAAVISMTRTLAMELGGSRIRVNAIAPGLIETKFAQVLVDNDAIRSSIVDRTAAGRVGQPRDISGGAVFLASDESDYITGDVMVIDGGWTLA
ncbi:MAG: glucose 1-dehydrogenase [Polyangiales bacterium]|jgi:NAD(P)-dependent dehydrogenase (short-subunit alcohol dehydrogenase family)